MSFEQSDRNINREMAAKRYRELMHKPVSELSHEEAIFMCNFQSYLAMTLEEQIEKALRAIRDE